MQEMTLSELLYLVSTATRPEEVFGPLSGDQAAALKRRYRRLVTIAHPDCNPGQFDQANNALRMLQEWYSAAQRRVVQGAYGATPRVQATTRLHEYIAYAEPISGDLCELYPAEAGARPVLLKVARQARDNDLLMAEAQALAAIDAGLAGQRVRAHFPTLIEHFQLRDQAGARRHTNVLLAETGYVTLAEVLKVYPRGVDLADAAWMFNRLLAALACAHGVGLVHGAVVPSHLLLRPADHNGLLVDWCYSVQPDATIKAISPLYSADYAPEVLAKQPATPATDIYMAASCMLRLLGGSPASQELPPSVPKGMRAFLKACLIPSPHRRPGDAWQVYDDLQELLKRLYGKRSFREFRMPAFARNGAGHA